jgi:hypothetical protein
MKHLIAPLFLVPTLSFAAPYKGAVSTATGGAGAAIVESSEIPFGNPAALGHLKGYHFTSSFARASQGEVNDSDMAFSISDSMPDTIVPTALSYSQNNTEDSLKNQLHQKHFRLSFGNMVHDRFAFGLGIGHDQIRLANKSFSDTNLTVGTLFSNKSNIGFAVVANNILRPNQNIPEELRPSQTITVGTSALYKRLVRFRVDATARLEDQMAKPLLGAGVENYLNKFSILRVGYQRDSLLEANVYSAGLGFVLPKFGLHYGYQQSPQKELLTRHSVDLAIPIW